MSSSNTAHNNDFITSPEAAIDSETPALFFSCACFRLASIHHASRLRQYVYLHNCENVMEGRHMW